MLAGNVKADQTAGIFPVVAEIMVGLYATLPKSKTKSQLNCFTVGVETDRDFQAVYRFGLNLRNAIKSSPILKEAIAVIRKSVIICQGEAISERAQGDPEDQFLIIFVMSIGILPHQAAGKPREASIHYTRIDGVKPAGR